MNDTEKTLHPRVLAVAREITKEAKLLLPYVPDDDNTEGYQQFVHILATLIEDKTALTALCHALQAAPVPQPEEAAGQFVFRYGTWYSALRDKALHILEGDPSDATQR